MGLLTQFLGWLGGLIDRTPVLLAVVRRYRDANGANVGELYLYDASLGSGAYRMIGASLDTLPLELGYLSLGEKPRTLDLEHDFLAPMPSNTLRVGATEPKYNEFVRETFTRMIRRNIRVCIQNRFIEHILDEGQKQ